MATTSAQMTEALSTVPLHVRPERVVDFDLYNPSGLEEGLYPAWKRLQAAGVPDLVWTPRNGGHWIATRGKLIRELFKDPEHFSSKCVLIPKAAGEEYTFIPISMDPPEHTQFRTLINSAIGVRAARRVEATMREMARDLIEKVRARGQCNFTVEYAETFPMAVFLTMVNLPLQDGPRLKKIVDQMTRPDGSLSTAAARQLLFDYLSPVIDERMVNPGEDAISVVIHGKVDARPLTRDEALRVCGLLLIGGLDTVINFLSFLMLFLAENPQHRRELAADPSRIPTSVDEFFRRLPLVSDARLIKHDIVVDGAQLKAGEVILLPTLLHGLDERENECPMQVDFKRKNATHSFFGGGPHRCAGLHIARAEVTITLEEWLSRIPEFELQQGHRPAWRSGIVSALDEELHLAWDPASTRASS